MTESATSDRARRRRASIVATAQDLAVRHGYSGFTVEDLAEAVGCSRRTLFNHVSSKEEAVLGALPHLDEEPVAVLRSGGPTGDLVEDLVATVVECLGGNGTDVADWQRMKDVCQRNPELLIRVQEHVEELVTQLIGHLSERDGVDDARAHIALALAGAVVQTTVHGLIEDPSAAGREADLATRVHDNLEIARELLAPGG